MSSSDQEYPRTVEEAVVRLPRVMRGPWTQDRAIATGNILHIFEVRFADGYSINPNTLEGALGLAEAAMIVSRLCDSPQRPWEEWKRKLPSGDAVTTAYAGVFDAVLAQLRSHPDIASVE